jgi:hypothetical protein
MIFLFNCSPEEATLEPIIAEYSGETGDTTFFWGREQGSNKVEWCQSFKISSDSTCSAVELKLGTRTGTPTGDYTIRIETNNTDRPSGTVVNAGATKTIAAASLIDESWNKWTFTSSFDLASNTTYWITCKTTEPALPNNRIAVMGDSNITYTLGDTAFYVNDAYVDTYTEQDFYFKVY